MLCLDSSLEFSIGLDLTCNQVSSPCCKLLIWLRFDVGGSTSEVFSFYFQLVLQLEEAGKCLN